MKVAIVNSYYSPSRHGGAELSVQSLAESLIKRGVHATVVCLMEEGQIAEEVVNGVFVQRIPLANIYKPYGETQHGALLKSIWHTVDSFNLTMGRRLQTVLRKLSPDLIHTNNLGGFSVAAWSVAAELSLPLAHTLRDYYLLCPRATMFRDGAPCQRQCSSCAIYSSLRRRASQLVSVAIGISDYVLGSHLRHHFFKGARFTRTIPNSVGKGSSIAAKGRSFPTEQIKVGYLGRLSPEKGLEILIAAARRLPAKYEVHIAGTGTREYVARLRSLAADSNILFVGEVSPWAFLGGIDTLVVPSLWGEPFGRVVAEAYFCGVPVVASRVGALTSLVDGRNTGRLYDSESPDQLATAVREVFRSPEIFEELSRSCLAAADQFAEESVANQYISVFEALRRND